jgi:osmoprotectant transport system permease protein
VDAAAEGDVSLLADAFKPYTFVDAFHFIGDNPHLILTKVVEHLELSGAAMGIALLLAIPLGVWLGHLHRGAFVAINISNVGRALPSLAVISIGLGFLGLGFWNVIFALTVLAWPPILTNAYVAVDGVDPDVIEAARGMGMRDRQILLKVELPLALPLIFAGIRTSAVYVVATATLASFVGGGGLGDIIVNQASYFLAGVVAASLVISALAFTADFAFGGLQWLVTPRGLRQTARDVLEPDVSTPALADVETA